MDKKTQPEIRIHVWKKALQSRWFALLLALAGLAGTALAAEDPNPFNRLFVPPQERVESLNSDGIHDPDNPSLKLLQEPKEAFQPLKRSGSGDTVDWVGSARKGIIKPRFDYSDPNKKPMPMDMEVVMEVKGSMPDVVFPHKAHTELLDCANCHPDVFLPQKGANQISMAQIMFGQSCGICHGTVAFPVTDCKACHSVTGGEKAKTKSDK
jgi:c(7)-type cytochrome triheme protein